MNKFLRLTLITILSVVFGNLYASDTNIDFTKNAITATDDGFTLEVSPFTFTAKQSTGKTKPTQNSKAKDLRIYAKGTLTVAATGTSMTKIVFNISAAGQKRLTDIQASAGSCTVDKDKWTVTWEGEATTEVTFTVGEAATYGTETGKTGQFDIDEATITTSGTVSTKAGAGLSWDKTSVSVEKGTNFTSPAFSKETTAEVSFSSDKENVATVDASGTISLGGEEGTATITATSQENDKYLAGTATCKITVFHYNIYTKATKITSGNQYLLVAQRVDSTYYAMPLSATSKYGYLQTKKIESKTDEIKVQSNYNDAFTIKTSGTGYTIQDPSNRYLYHDGTYHTFSVKEGATDAWTFEAQSDGTYKISYSDGYYAQFGDGIYTSIGLYNEAKTGTDLVYLYEYNEKGTTGINHVIENSVSDENAPVYNLAGQRVDKSYKGIVIKKGKKYFNK